MSTNHVAAFIAANPTACNAAFKVFKAIEANDFASTLAAAGITGPDIRVFATIYVAQATGVKPHPSERGGALVFRKDTSEYNRVKYLVDVATGVREARAAKKAAKAEKHNRLSAEVRSAAKAFLALCNNDLDAAIAALRAVAK